jgi:hypothetical protein
MHKYGIGLVALVLLAAGVAGGASGVAAQSPPTTCKSPTTQPLNVSGWQNSLFGVAATSDCKAWAVGRYGSNSIEASRLIEYWDGTAWQIQESPSVNTDLPNALYGVAAISSTSAWAVGTYAPGINESQPLIERWNGTDWEIQNNPNPGISTQNLFRGVAATSPTNAWAVGQYEKNLGHSTVVLRTLIEHWDGSAWTIQKSPNVPSGKKTIFSPNSLYGVAATSPTNAWTVGHHVVPSTVNSQTLIEHWDGTAWRVQKSPNHGGTARSNRLLGVAATSPTNAWAVGFYENRHCLNPSCSTYKSFPQTLILHWNGKAWNIQKSPNPAGSYHSNLLRGVAATSPSNAWAVGSQRGQPLILHWDGKTWKVQKSPKLASSYLSNFLRGVAATSAGNAWTVGSATQNTARQQTFALHWNGSAWSP